VADNVTFTNSGTGAVPNGTVIASRDSGSGQWQQVDVGPAVATAVTGGQYALSVSTSTVTTLTVPSGATHCWLSVEPTSVAIRWTRDGSASYPTTTQGHYLAGGDAIELDNLSNVRLIGITNAATVQVSYHKYV